MNSEDDKDLFAAQMQGVTPLVTPRTDTRKSWQGASEEQLQRRRAAEAFAEDAAEHNFLTLSEVEAREPLRKHSRWCFSYSNRCGRKTGAVF